MKYFSTFSGMGTDSHAIHSLNLKWDNIGWCDIDRSAQEMYKLNFPEHKNFYPDITEIDWNNVEPFDILFGGFPCVAFSIQGKRMGFEDTRGTLIFNLVDGLKTIKPRYGVFENVKGLLNHHKGKTFEIILNTLSDIGYYVKYKILNTKDYGVPQNRERLWMIAFRDKEDFDNFEWPEKNNPNDFKVIHDILDDNIPENLFLDQNLVNFYKTIIEKKLEGMPFPTERVNKIQNFYSMRLDHGFSPTRQNPLPPNDELSNSLSSKYLGKPIRHEASKRIYSVYGVAPTLTCASGKGIMITNGEWFRTLTVNEQMKLQGFDPKNVKTEGIPVNQIYKQLGNGWSLNIICKILNSLLK